MTLRCYLMLVFFPNSVIFLLASCQRPCRTGYVNPVFIGYSINQIDTLVIKSYMPNTNFTVPVDSFSTNYGTIYTTINDTTIVRFNDNISNHFINAGYDYIIYLPHADTSYFISNIVSTATEGSNTCVNPITSLSINGVKNIISDVETGLFYTSGNMMYLKK